MGIFKRSASEDAKSFDNMRDTMLNNIWLAGLGAYAKSIEEVNELSGKSRTLFDELLERGREMDARSKEEEPGEKPSKNAASFEARLNQIIQKVTGIDSERLETVDGKLDHLTAQVELLLQAKQEAKADEPKAPEAEAKPTTPRRKTTRKTTAKADTTAAETAES